MSARYGPSWAAVWRIGQPGALPIDSMPDDHVLVGSNSRAVGQTCSVTAIDAAGAAADPSAPDAAWRAFVVVVDPRRMQRGQCACGAIAAIDAGGLRPIPSTSYPLSQADAVMNRLEAGEILGRAVLVPD